MKKEIKFLFRASTVGEEVEEVWQILNNYSWYKTNGYSLNIPKDKKIDNLIQISLKEKGLQRKNRNQIKQIIQDTYDEKYFKNGLNVLNSLRQDIHRCFPKFVEYEKLWKFGIHKTYEVIITLYGTEGSYDVQTRRIYILIKKGDQPKRNYFFQTIIHELVHIGIEDFIKKFKITHNEKERIVDLFCSREFKIKKYILQNIGDIRIDNYIVSGGFRNLPLALKKYVRDFPR
ncbi:hypothetical protein J4471_00700 [Candidatus Woesearchaeota archaeon]|nr:hypothetical protein [Candidatus Woesearchaeota archaeon]